MAEVDFSMQHLVTVQTQGEQHWLAIHMHSMPRHQQNNDATHLMMSTRPTKGVLLLTGTLKHLKSKEPIRPGNWREAAMPVPSMPGM